MGSIVKIYSLSLNISEAHLGVILAFSTGHLVAVKSLQLGKELNLFLLLHLVLLFCILDNLKQFFFGFMTEHIEIIRFSLFIYELLYFLIEFRIFEHG